MITRILPADEWHKLDASGLPALLRHLRPADCQVVAVEDEGRIVGTLGVLKMTHYEGVWVAPDKRNGYILGRLLSGAGQLVREMGESAVLGAAQDDDVVMDELIRRRGGVPLPIRVYAMPVGER